MRPQLSECHMNIVSRIPLASFLFKALFSMLRIRMDRCRNLTPKAFGRFEKLMESYSSADVWCSGI